MRQAQGARPRHSGAYDTHLEKARDIPATDYIDGDTVDSAAFAHVRGRLPEARGLIRACAADFRVEEDCPITLSGSGEHLWCHVEKTGCSTSEAVQKLSRATGIQPRNIGFAGLKDKHATTRQWFSLAWPISQPLPALDELDGLTVLTRERHQRKLRRGAHRGNWFVLRIRAIEGSREMLAADLKRIRSEGVPNYFGAQRFGFGGRNLALSRALFAGKKLSRNRRGFALSAARSLLFNAVVDARVRAANWERLIAGEAIMLDGSHSVFALDDSGQPNRELERRLAAFDIHPSGPLPGQGEDDVVAGEARKLERSVLEHFPDLLAGLERSGVDSGRRALRLPVRELEWSFEADASLIVRFWLPPGAFATSVLRELVTIDIADG